MKNFKILKLKHSHIKAFVLLFTLYSLLFTLSCNCQIPSIGGMMKPIVAGSTDNSGIFMAVSSNSVREVSYTTTSGVSWVGSGYSDIINGFGITSDASVIYMACTGDSIRKTTDNFATNVGLNRVANWSGIATSDNGQYITATISTGLVYVSNDYGETWASKLLSKSWQDVDMSSSGQYQVVSSYNYNLYVSNDYGQTWTDARTKDTYRGVSVSNTGQYMIVGRSGAGTKYPLYSNDYGQTWTEMTNLAYNIEFALAISGDGSHIIAADYSSAPIYISDDYGASFTLDTINGSVYYWRDAAINNDGSIMAFVNYSTTADIFTSTDHGQNWTTNTVINYIIRVVLNR